jgi:putative MATE family efflux protein
MPHQDEFDPRQIEITEGHLLRAAWQQALPMLAQALLQNVFMIVDMIFVGRLGKEAVGAVGLSAQIMGFLWMIGVGVTTGSTALVSQAFGRRDRAHAQRAVGQAMLLMLLFSAALIALTPLARTVLSLFGADRGVTMRGTGYLQINMAGSFAMLLGLTFATALRGAGDPLSPLKAFAVANVVNLALDPVLIFGLGPIPAFGVSGSAAATVIARTVGLAILGRMFFGPWSDQFHMRWRHLRPRFRIIWHIFKIGVFGSGQMLLWNVSGIVLISLVTGFGTAVLAAYTIGMRLRLLVMMPGFAFGNAANTMVGQNIGADKPRRAARSAWVSTFMCSALTLTIGVICIVLPGSIIRLFNNDPSVIDAGTSFLRWYAPFFVTLSFSTVLSRAMNGAGDTLWPMLVTAVSVLVVRIPLAYALAGWWNSAAGVWAALAVSNLLQAGGFVMIFLWGRWKGIGRRNVDAARAGKELC